jgi:hypothetical protein
MEPSVGEYSVFKYNLSLLEFELPHYDGLGKDSVSVGSICAKVCGILEGYRNKFDDLFNYQIEDEEDIHQVIVRDIARTLKEYSSRYRYIRIDGIVIVEYSIFGPSLKCRVVGNMYIEDEYKIEKGNL